MPSMRSFEGRSANADEYVDELRKQFPDALFGTLRDISEDVLQDLKTALRQGEEEIQRVLTKNPYLIQYAVQQSGHQGIWVYPKPMIKPRGADGSKGMIPDYLIATRSSLGYFWHVVELKRFEVQFANKDGHGYSMDGQEAIAQLNEYLAHFQDYIDAVRNNVRISELIQPSGAILLIGDGATESDAQRTCRANFVRNNPKLAVVSYRRIIASLESDLNSGLGSKRSSETSRLDGDATIRTAPGRRLMPADRVNTRRTMLPLGLDGLVLECVGRTDANEVAAALNAGLEPPADKESLVPTRGHRGVVVETRDRKPRRRRRSREAAEQSRKPEAEAALVCVGEGGRGQQCPTNNKGGPDRS